MNKIIDYSKYHITSTSAFNDGIAKLKKAGLSDEVKKLFRVIDEIIEDVDMYEAENARPLKINKEVWHIHLDGRRSGDIILLYKVSGHAVDFDLRLHNITNHADMDRNANSKFIDKQKLAEFDVIRNKYSKEQIDLAESCFLELVSDYRFYQYKGQAKSDYVDKFLKDFYDDSECEDPLTYDEFLQIIQYFGSQYNKAVFGSIDLSRGPMRTAAITEREERYILQLFQDYGIEIDDAYIETEIDEYGDVYEYMRIESVSDSYRLTKLLEAELYSLEKLFEIHFNSVANGLGSWGKTYEFSHYFEE